MVTLFNAICGWFVSLIMIIMSTFVSYKRSPQMDNVRHEKKVNFQVSDRRCSLQESATERRHSARDKSIPAKQASLAGPLWAGHCRPGSVQGLCPGVQVSAQRGAG